MSDISPLLSICIPTFNRAALLEKTLECLTSQSAFLDTAEVEIVISDNHSDDNTQDLSESYVRRFPGKIRYHRNATNIVDGNMEMALSLGSGAFLKLNNDNLLCVNGTLAEMLKVIDATVAEKPVLFFSK